jgi:hypothetical protein
MLRIPIGGSASSLNAASAGTVVCMKLPGSVGSQLPAEQAGIGNHQAVLVDVDVSHEITVE